MPAFFKTETFLYLPPEGAMRNSQLDQCSLTQRRDSYFNVWKKPWEVMVPFLSVQEQEYIFQDKMIKDICDCSCFGSMAGCPAWDKFTPSDPWDGIPAPLAPTYLLRGRGGPGKTRTCTAYQVLSPLFLAPFANVNIFNNFFGKINNYLHTIITFALRSIFKKSYRQWLYAL